MQPLSQTSNNFIGIDVSKNQLEFAIHGSKHTYQYSNSPTGVEQLYKEHKNSLCNALVVVEPTGGYEKLIIRYLLKQHVAVHRADTRKVKSFIRSYGVYGKTDKIDALMLALYAMERQSKIDLYKPNSDIQEKLKKLFDRREELVKYRAAEKNRLQSPDNHIIEDTIIATIEHYSKMIAIIEANITKLVDENSCIKKKTNILQQQITGIGEVTALAIIAYLPELGKMSNKKISALAGLAPYPNDSGNYNGYRKAKGGRVKVKLALHMPAVSASRTNSNLGEFYKRLIDNGKPPLKAILAVKRKMIVIANAKIRDFYLNNNAVA